MPTVSPSPYREWGDGATDVRLHVIADISYRSDAIVCRCGEVVTGIRDGSGWLAHGGGVLRLTDAEGRDAEPGPSSEARAARALFMLAAVGKRCTCTPDSDVGECPNFIPDDLDPEGDTDDAE